MPSTYEPIATQTLGSAAASVTFSSIPSTYTDLVLITAGKFSANESSYKIQVNSDTGTNYSNTFLYGDGTSAASGRFTNGTFLLSGRSSTSEGNGITQFQNYSNTTTYKTVLSRGNSTAITIAIVGLWRSTAAISSMVITSETASNLQTGSTFTLYGIKSA
jgi:hypothetical protein